MPPASASILSPSADPFFPSECFLGAVYNDGVPCGLINEHESIANIPDQAIDELFPPTASDAAELDAVDDFLSMMVDLSLIEDVEERARNDSLSCLVKKRWEVRRKEGLRGRPHLFERTANHNEVPISSPNSPTETRVAHLIHDHARQHERRQNKEALRQQQMKVLGHKVMRGHAHSRPIQQPRKQN